AALEINLAKGLLVAAAAITRSDVAVIVSATGRILTLGQRLDRLAGVQPRTVDQDQLALRGGDRIIGLQCHYPLLTAPSLRRLFDPLPGSPPHACCRRCGHSGRGTCAICRDVAAC